MPRHRRGWAMGVGRGSEDRHSPVTISLLEPALLILLKERPRHGYTLLFDLDAWGMSTIHPSVVYRILRDLEELAWIQSDWDTSQTQGPPRRIYRLTDQGEAALENWQREIQKIQGTIALLLEHIKT